MFCSKCGKELQNEVVYCSACGNKVSKEANEIQEKKITYVNTGVGVPKFQCPHCMAGNVQKLSMAYENGISVSTINSTGVGVGVAGGKLGVGIGKSKGTSNTKTELAKKIEPPKKQSMISIIGICFVMMVIIGNTIGWGFFTTIFAGIVIVGGIYGCWDHNKNVYPREIEKWNKQYLCLVCGTRFYEDGTVEEEKKAEGK